MKAEIIQPIKQGIATIMVCIALASAAAMLIGVSDKETIDIEAGHSITEDISVDGSVVTLRTPQDRIDFIVEAAKSGELCAVLGHLPVADDSPVIVWTCDYCGERL